MGDVGAVAEGVENEDVEAVELFQAFGRDAVGVGAVGDVADAEAEDVEARPVVQADGSDFCAEQVEGFEADGVKGELWGRAGVGGLAVAEGVVERFANAVFDERLAVERDGMAEVEREEAKIVEAKDVVGVLVGEEDGVDDADLLAEELLAEVGRGVDQ